MHTDKKTFPRNFSTSNAEMDAETGTIDRHFRKNNENSKRERFSDL